MHFRDLPSDREAQAAGWEEVARYDMPIDGEVVIMRHPGFRAERVVSEG